MSRRLVDRGLRVRNLRVSHAFHSRLLDPMLDDFARVVDDVPVAPPRIPVVSNVTGQVLTGLVDGQYWRRHARDTVQFAASIATLADAGISIAVEVGPAPALSSFVRRTRVDIECLASLRPRRDDWSQVLETLATLYVRGCSVDWAGCYRASARERVALPVYPFQGERYWISNVEAGAGRASSRALRSSSAVEQPPVSPLLDRRLSLPMSKEVRFELTLIPDRLAYLCDHRIEDRGVFPAAAIAEMALEGAAEMFGAAPRAIERLTLSQPLMIDVGNRADLQIILLPDSELGAGFQIVGQCGDRASEWTLYATGRVTQRAEAAAVDAGLLDSVRARCREEMASDFYYRWLAEQGLTYRDRFRSIDRLWRGPGEALARVRLPEGADLASYQLHPILLDASLQAIGAALPGALESQAKGVYLPMTAARVEFASPAPAELWAVVRVSDGSSDDSNVSAEVVLVDNEGHHVASVKDVRLKRVPRGSIASRGNVDDAFYEVVWRERAPSVENTEPGDAAASLNSTHWVVFADNGGVGVPLAALLRHTGSRCTLIHQGREYDETGAAAITVDPAQPEHFTRLFERAWASEKSPCGVVYLWNLDARSIGDSDGEAVHRDDRDGCAALLHLIQAAVTASPRIWIVTAGAQPVGNEEVVQHPVQAMSWGVGRVLAREHPECRPVMIDLDPLTPSSESARQLASELLASDREDQVAWRDGVRYAARLDRWSPSSSVAPLSAESYRLEIGKRGTLDGINLRPDIRVRPRAGEVEMCVAATGLNFRDVLNALGLYPGDAGPLGLECVGAISALGEGVDDLHVGEQVVAIAPASFRRYVTTPRNTVVPKPKHVTDVAAATLPIAFLTAMYALRNVAHLQKGERVLVHAAAGGVGLAAIQIARLAGAEVLATTGSSVKREYLQSIGVDRVSDSRSTAFVDDVRGWAPEGVDVVLNSLAGDLIPAGLSLLRDEGRFVEIGKQPKWDADRVRSINPAVSYTAFDLSEVIRQQPALLQTMLLELMAAIDTRQLSPLPHRVFPMRRVENAFRHMAQARHIGKVVVSHPPAAPAARADGPMFRADATYAITGGLGALGLHVAAWAAARGARELCLLGRGEPSDPARAAIARLQSAGAHVTTMRVDVGDRAALATALTCIEEKHPPIRGVFHLAGVLDDGLLRSQRWEQWRDVLAPKVDGAWNLHALTLDRPLDFFVLFSSASALVGAPGQASYAAANAFLDALAAYRASQGMTALSVSWGPWAGDGMAGRAKSDAQRRWSAHGFTALDANQATLALERVMMAGAAHVAVVPIDWATLEQSGDGQRTSPFFSSLVRAVPRGDAGPAPRPGRRTVAEWRAAPGAKRHGLTSAYVRAVLYGALGLDAQHACSAQQPFGEIGLDSLMAVEIRNTLAEDLGRALPATLLFDYPTIDALAGYLEVTTCAEDAGARTKQEQPPASRAVEQALLAVEQLSDRDVEAALLAKSKLS
ncbi:MAG TPA: SDR family NAD(P)-dependent oxidoreductase [Vicinamibacterales bacterium]